MPRIRFYYDQKRDWRNELSSTLDLDVEFEIVPQVGWIVYLKFEDDTECVYDDGIREFEVVEIRAQVSPSAMNKHCPEMPRIFCYVKGYHE